MVWKYEQDDRGHWSKPAYQPDGQPVEADQPRTWSSFESCLEAYLRSRDYGAVIGADTGARIKFDGIGFELGATERPQWGIVGVDIDHVSQHAAEAERIVALLDSYTEHTPGRDGLRIFCSGQLPDGRRKRWGYEAYSRHRFLSVTGHRLEDRPADIRRADRALYQFWLQYIHRGDVPDRKVRR